MFYGLLEFFIAERQIPQQMSATVKITVPRKGSGFFFVGTVYSIRF
jgi:hypothetical protein